MPGSQNSPGASPGGTRRANTSLRPVVCRQINEATRSSNETEILIDGVEASQLTFVAQIVGMNTQATNLVLTLDDGTGSVETRQWIDSSQGNDEDTIRGIAEHQWVRVLGTIKNFANRRHFSAMVVRPVVDMTEVYFALLEALQVHLLYTRGPHGGAQGASGQLANASASAYNPGAANTAQGDQFSHLPAMERKIVHFILNSAPGDDGVHVTTLTKGLGPNVNAEDVSNALDRLTESGHIYNTVDEFHYHIST